MTQGRSFSGILDIAIGKISLKTFAPKLPPTMRIFKRPFLSRYLTSGGGIDEKADLRGLPT